MNKKSDACFEKADALLELIWVFHNFCVNSYIDQKYIDAVVKHDFTVVLPRVGGIQVIDRVGLNFYETNNDDKEAQFTLKRGDKACRISSYGEKRCWLCGDRKSQSFTVLQPAFVDGKYQKERDSFGVGFIIEEW